MIVTMTVTMQVIGFMLVWITWITSFAHGQDEQHRHLWHTHHGWTPYEPPPWWDRLQEQDTSGFLRTCQRWVRRGLVPRSSRPCGVRPKLCYFDTQECPGVGPHPVTRCECVRVNANYRYGTRRARHAHRWSCRRETCPVKELPPDGSCSSDEDCEDPTNLLFQVCFGPQDDFCGICRNFPLGCLSDEDCIVGDNLGGGGGTVCDTRRIPCLCDPGPTCNAPCTRAEDCAAGDTCLPDGHCVPTTCTTDVDCVDQFVCDTSASNTCERRTCSTDVDCLSGYCVKGLCFDQRGFCSALPP